MQPHKLIALLESLIPGHTDTINHFDQVIIHSRKKKVLVERHLPIDLLCEHCSNFKVEWPDEVFKEHGWFSRIKITVPSQYALTLLQENENIIKPYIISKVEVAKDLIADSHSLSRLERIVQRFHEIILINYSKKGDDYKVMGRETEELDSYTSDKGGFTSYIKTKSWALVIYARKSKLTGQNCIHMEWRFFGTASVKRNTGIETVNDLYQFDPKKFWEVRERYISESGYSIDKERFAKFLIGMDGRKQFDKNIGQPPSKRIRSTYGKAMLLAEHYLSGVDSVTAFKQMISDWKTELKKRSDRRNDLAERILKVNFKQFLKPLDISTIE